MTEVLESALRDAGYNRSVTRLLMLTFVTSSSPHPHPILTPSSPHPHPILTPSSPNPHPILTSSCQ